METLVIYVLGFSIGIALDAWNLSALWIIPAAVTTGLIYSSIIIFGEGGSLGMQYLSRRHPHMDFVKGEPGALGQRDRTAASSRNRAPLTRLEPSKQGGLRQMRR